MNKAKALRVLTKYPAHCTGSKYVRMLFEKIDASDIVGDRGESPYKKVNDRYVSSEWSAYGRCIKLTVKVVGNMIVLDYTVYNGDAMYGEPTYLRFKRTLKVPAKKYIGLFKEEADSVLRREAERAWEAYKRNWKAHWVDSF